MNYSDLITMVILIVVPAVAAWWWIQRANGKNGRLPSHDAGGPKRSDPK